MLLDVYFRQWQICMESCLNRISINPFAKQASTEPHAPLVREEPQIQTTNTFCLCRLSML